MGSASDDDSVSGESVSGEERLGGESDGFLAFYDSALPEVYGYLSARCKTTAVAEDLTAETMLAAADASRRDNPLGVSLPWVIGIARHKLVDQWRREERETRRFRLSWQHRAALTLRYLDDLPVAEVAAALSRTVHATEALLVRAREAFRRDYGEEDSRD